MLHRPTASRNHWGSQHAVVLDVENAAHDALPIPTVQDAVLDFLRGADVRGRLATTPPMSRL
jgi:hypothetical protein